MLFISHKDADRSAAEALVNCVLSSLELPEDQVRCTSVPGFTLPYGKTISAQLREDIGTSAVIFALLTESSLKSQWVLFELGASWALSKVVIPILGPGLDHRALPGPLASYPSIAIGDSRAASNIAESLAQASRLLGVAEKTGGRRQSHLERFVSEFSRLAMATNDPTPSQPGPPESLQVKAETTGSFFGGRLRITVVAIAFEGSPFRHLLVATLNAPKHEPQRLERVEAGFAVNYAGFDVYVMAVETFYATFDVVENQR